MIENFTDKERIENLIELVKQYMNFNSTYQDEMAEQLRDQIKKVEELL